MLYGFSVILIALLHPVNGQNNPATPGSATVATVTAIPTVTPSAWDCFQNEANNCLEAVTPSLEYPASLCSNGSYMEYIGCLQNGLDICPGTELQKSDQLKEAFDYFCGHTNEFQVYLTCLLKVDKNACASSSSSDCMSQQLEAVCRGEAMSKTCGTEAYEAYMHVTPIINPILALCPSIRSTQPSVISSNTDVVTAVSFGTNATDVYASESTLPQSGTDSTTVLMSKGTLTLNATTEFMKITEVLTAVSFGTNATDASTDETTLVQSAIDSTTMVSKVSPKANTLNSTSEFKRTTKDVTTALSHVPVDAGQSLSSLLNLSLITVSILSNVLLNNL